MTSEFVTLNTIEGEKKVNKTLAALVERTWDKATEKGMIEVWTVNCNIGECYKFHYDNKDKLLIDWNKF